MFTRTIFYHILLIYIFLVPLIPSVSAYPEDQLHECILAAKTNPSLLGVPETSIEGFCDCALNYILDQGKNAKNSANQCIKIHLNK